MHEHVNPGEIPLDDPVETLVRYGKMCVREHSDPFHDHFLTPQNAAYCKPLSPPPLSISEVVVRIKCSNYPALLQMKRCREGGGS
jgi:hypothetical protein